MFPFYIDQCPCCKQNKTIIEFVCENCFKNLFKGDNKMPKKMMMVMMLLMLWVSVANAETSLAGYGFYENVNEISAKDEAINLGINNTYDFQTTPNQDGESLGNGKYYVPIRYNGGYNGTDEDYIYLNELKGKDGTNGKDGQIDAKTLNNLTSGINTSYAEAVNVDNRLNKLEATQHKIVGKIRWHDSQKWEVESFVEYTSNRNTISAVGLEMTYKFGKSWSEKKMEEMEKRLETLERR